MWPFKKKKKYSLVDELEALFAKESLLRKEGWIYWCAMPPMGYPEVYARRTNEEAVDIIRPAELHPMFNVANLWWMPHRGERQLN